MSEDGLICPNCGELHAVSATILGPLIACPAQHENVISLVSAGRESAFRFGAKSHWRMRDDGSLRPETWRDRWASAIAETVWPRGKFVVTEIDTANGRITLGDA